MTECLPSLAYHTDEAEAQGSALHRTPPHRPALAARNMTNTHITTARHLIAIERQIDWQEVGTIALHGLQVLVVMTLLARPLTRRAWDAPVTISERSRPKN